MEGRGGMARVPVRQYAESFRQDYKGRGRATKGWESRSSMSEATSYLGVRGFAVEVS